MKITQLNVLADQGSTGKIVACVDSELQKRGYESLICYGRKSTTVPGRFHFGTEAEAALSKIANRAGRLMFASSYIATRKLLKKIAEEQPDLVHVHCINGYCVNIYSVLEFLAKKDIPTVITHHAEFYYTGSCGHSFDCLKYTQPDGCNHCPRSKSSTGSLIGNNSSKAWNRMRDAIGLFKSDKLRFTAVSPWVKERSLKSPIVNSFPCDVVGNGVDSSIFHCRKDRKKILSLVPECKDKVVLHVTAAFSDDPNSIKGGKDIIELARKMPECTFIVAASYSSVKCELPKNLFFWGRTKDQQELSELYNAADATVIASKRETFSMIVAESLCCGTPIVGYKAGGPESIAIPEYSVFVDYGNIQALEQSLRTVITKDCGSEEISAKAISRFSESAMTEGYISVYSKLLKNGK